MDFKNKVCIITGGTNGIGRCIAEEFLSEGAKVAVIDTDPAGSSLVEKYGEDKVLFVTGDIAHIETLEDFASQVIAKYKNVDFLVNNACISKKGILSGCGYDDFNYVLKLGITAPYMLSLLFKDKFNEGASIVNISSTRAYMSQADTESYSAAKGGISALTHALSVSFSDKVRVNSVSPGWIDTTAYHGTFSSSNFEEADLKQHPAGRIGIPEDIAKAVMFLCSSEAGFITGQNINIDGGMSKLMIFNNDRGWTYKI